MNQLLHSHLELGLRIAAVAQLAIALVNLFLVRIMKWTPELKKMPLLMSEVFRVHCLFISFTLAIFGSLTWRFASDLATAANPMCTWLAISIGSFWLVRSLIQWLQYSPSHWLGQAGRTLIHFLLFFGYGAFATVYLAAAFWRNS